MFDDPIAARKMNDDKSKKDYNTRSTEMDKKYFLPWCPLDEKKLLLKHRYISCSRSVPRRSKRFDRYKINRSLNFDSNIHNSSSENSSFEEDKHLSRSAKIMKALSSNTSPSYYGRTKIKKSLNFNVTPSVKRFMPPKKSIRKSLSLNFGSPLSVSNKLSNFDNDSSDSVNNKLIFTSSESIDENQNETPSQHSAKEHETLHFSTPNTKLSKQSLNSPSFTPLLRSRLKETIDNIVYITATSSSQSLKCIKGRSKCLDNVITNTSRNLYLEFHDNDDDRPCTPENLIRIVPESMSAIKRSHKKERSSRRSGHCIPEPASNFEKIAGSELTLYKKPIDHSETIDRSSSRNSNSEYVPLYNSEDNISDTGSLFDYTEELKNILQEPKTESDCMSNSNIVLPEFYEPKCCIKIEKEEVENLLDAHTLNQSEVVQKTIDIKTENSSGYDVDAKTEVRSVTPVLTAEVLPGSQKSITPENRVNILQQISYDSIKKSHKKNKGANRKQFFSSKVLPCKLEVAEQDDRDCLENSEQDQSIDESKLIVDENNVDTSEVERACTPEKVNSSRLLLSQFSSVKRSHKKDKHTKILSGFLKRQEYFNKEIDFDRDTKDKAFDIDDGFGYKKSMEDLSDFDNTANSNDSSYLLNMSSDKSSPSKRKISLNTSSDRDANVSCDSELQECDVSREEFQIFTPLKRKRSLIAPAAKEYLHFYDLPSGSDEISEEAIANISFSRCLTPVPSLQENYMKSGENHLATVKSDNVSSNDKTGRSTPRNMSTEELYNNLDSIKKSHKKNKSGNILRKGFDLIRNNLCEGKGQISSENIKKEICEKLELSDDSIAVYDANKSVTDESIDHDNFESLSSSSASDQNLSTTHPKTALQNVTPPNSFKAKNYLRVLQETSIKRSHKKVRDQKKHDFTIDTNELSDDGSIFGDKEELVYMDEQTTRE
ncbi:uncharacterized protein LOC143343233 [Colletes latitarsis]|uniref:uncharacterized protein LOC143343233 n=1 Tax=Colletes latitarsis TaxID=2605962 RepID=UPI00403662A7